MFKNWDNVDKDTVIDLAAAINGGKAIACNDMFFSAMGNLIMLNRGPIWVMAGKQNATAHLVTVIG